MLATQQLALPKPTVSYLERFVSGSSIKPISSLRKAVRLWVTLRSFIDNSMELSFPISHGDWYQRAIAQQALYSDGLTGARKLRPLHSVTVAEWLFEVGGAFKEAWIEDYCCRYHVDRKDVLDCLGQFPFVCNTTELSYRRHLKYDFEALLMLGCFEKDQVSANRNLFQLADPLPDWLFSNLEEHGDLGDGGQAFPAPEVVRASDLAEIFVTYREPIRGVQRFFMDLEYVVKEREGDQVSKWQQRLSEEVWAAPAVPPILIDYRSISTQRNHHLVTYPVAIFYSRRAPYLCAYGQTPHALPNESNFYQFRLDRMGSLKVLQWPEKRDAAVDKIPSALVRDYFSGMLPVPEQIDEMLQQAWGFDIGLPVSPLLLRFDRQFHDGYIDKSDRHHTFTYIESLEEIEGFIESTPIPPAQQQAILDRVRARQGDAFYFAQYRDLDHNFLMRLRAWGPMVEVLYPPRLRDRMRADMQQTYALYREEL